MGRLEKIHTKKRKRKDLQRLILSVVGATGVIGIGMLAPNAIGAMGKLGMLPTKRQKDSIRTTRDDLVRKGLLIYEDGKLRLTKDGVQKLGSFLVKNYEIKKPRRWDRRWRVLIFDISEKRKGVRDGIRKSLIAVGFIRLQDSVWVYPYDCEDFIVLLKADFKIGRDVLYMIVDTLEYDDHLRKHFGLPSE